MNVVSFPHFRRILQSNQNLMHNFCFSIPTVHYLEKEHKLRSRRHKKKRHKRHSHATIVQNPMQMTSDTESPQEIAVIQIQKRARGRSSRRKLHMGKRSAIKLQAAARGHGVRTRTLKLFEMTALDLHKFAEAHPTSKDSTIRGKVILGEDETLRESRPIATSADALRKHMKKAAQAKDTGKNSRLQQIYLEAQKDAAWWSHELKEWLQTKAPFSDTLASIESDFGGSIKIMARLPGGHAPPVPASCLPYHQTSDNSTVGS